jgi:hypothetical protein
MISKDKNFLDCLGWRLVYDDGREGRWCVCAVAGRHTVLGIADTQEEAWAAASSMALHVTAPSLRERREGRS